MPLSNFNYSRCDINFISRAEKESLFDFLLQSIWEAKVKDGLFRYELGYLRTKCLDGKYNFIVQLNINRALERRKPELVTDVLMDFDPEKFHFGKVDKEEVLFNFLPYDWDLETRRWTHPFLINVSPLEYCHSLLVPCIEDRLPQVLTFEALRIAMEVLLISNSRHFRMGFNSLGGFASVNNLHIHAYYLEYTLFLENATVSQLRGPCYEVVDFPSEGFAFEVHDRDKIVEVARSVLRLTNFLVENKIAHNVFITRGTPFVWPVRREYHPTNPLGAMRIYVWARESCFGVKDEMAFNIAVCELAGHIPMKDEETFENITEGEIAAHLNRVCHDTFISIKEKVKDLY